MKYASNHCCFFRNPGIAFTSGLLQTSICFITEILNIVLILASPNVLEAVLNFCAIAIINEFDDFVFSVIKYDSDRSILLEDGDVDDTLLEVYHTTSRNAHSTEYTTVPDIK